MLSVGSKPPLTPRARKRKTPHTSWINFFTCLVEGGGLCPLPWHAESLPHSLVWHVGRVDPES